MMNFSIASLAAGGMDWGESLSTAGTVTLLGMATIFSVLAILWGLIEIMHALLHRGEKAEKATAKQAPASPVGGDAAIAAAIAASLAAAEDDGATVAAITAAITAMRAETGESGSFRVVSFKRVERANGRRR